jgi:hypothetical protein
MQEHSLGTPPAQEETLDDSSSEIRQASTSSLLPAGDALALTGPLISAWQPAETRKDQGGSEMATAGGRWGIDGCWAARKSEESESALSTIDLNSPNSSQLPREISDQPLSESLQALCTSASEDCAGVDFAGRAEASAGGTLAYKWSRKDSKKQGGGGYSGQISPSLQGGVQAFLCFRVPAPGNTGPGGGGGGGSL